MFSWFNFKVLLCLYCTSGCDSSYDISIRPLTWSGIQSTLSEMVSDYRNRFCVYSSSNSIKWAFLSTGTAAILLFYLMQR